MDGHVNWYVSLRVLLAATAVCLLSCAGKQERQEAYLLRGQEYLDAQKYPEAEIEFRNALQVNPKLAVAHFKLGKTYLAMKDFRGAFTELRRALDLDDDLPEARLELGRLCHGQ